MKEEADFYENYYRRRKLSSHELISVETTSTKSFINSPAQKLKEEEVKAVTLPKFGDEDFEITSSIIISLVQLTIPLAWAIYGLAHCHFKLEYKRY